MQHSYHSLEIKYSSGSISIFLAAVPQVTADRARRRHNPVCRKRQDFTIKLVPGEIGSPQYGATDPTPPDKTPPSTSQGNSISCQHHHHLQCLLLQFHLLEHAQCQKDFILKSYLSVYSKQSLKACV